MMNDFMPYLLSQLIRNILYAITYTIRSALNAFNKLHVNYYCPKFKIPFCASTKIMYSNTNWKKSWKTEVIERLVNVDDGIFIDVGANVGQTLLDLLLVHPIARYVGFEPNSSCVFYLKELIRENSFNKCLIVPVGLSDQTQCLPLYYVKNEMLDPTARMASDLKLPGWLYDIDYVPCFKFDDILHSLNIGAVNFVKIDVEGSELQVLTGMRKSLQEFRPVILCEVLFPNIKAHIAYHKTKNDRLIQFLEDLNYEVLQLLKSNDDAHVIDVKKIKSFTLDIYTENNKSLCDYLLIPREREAHVLNALLPLKTPNPAFHPIAI